VRFADDATMAANRDAVAVVGEVAEAHGCTPGQVALAWVLAQGDDVVPIPGTKRTSYLEQNAAAADVSLTADDLARLDEVRVATPRYADATWINRSTPPLTAP
jgi:aryl-alcohol dehydrogenase-like predicted oxidoreductase